METNSTGRQHDDNMSTVKTSSIVQITVKTCWIFVKSCGLKIYSLNEVKANNTQYACLTSVDALNNFAAEFHTFQGLK